MTDIRAARTPSADTSDLSPRLEKGVRDWIGRQFGSADGWNINAVMTIGASSRKRSFFRARDGSGHSFAIKQHSSRRRNRTEFKALETLHRLSPKSVAPLYLAKDYRYFLMSWIDGPLLSDVIGQPGREALLHQAGAWMAGFHGASHRRPMFMRSKKAPALEAPIRNGSDVIATAATRLRENLNRLSKGTAPMATLHGDLHAGNFFVRDGDLIAFDREQDTFGLTFLDVAKFLTDLTQRRDAAAAEGRPWDGDPDSDRRAFFDGYGPVRQDQVALFDVVEDLFTFRQVWRRIQSAARPEQDALFPVALRGIPGNAPRAGRLILSQNGTVGWSQTSLLF